MGRDLFLKNEETNKYTLTVHLSHTGWSRAAGRGPQQIKPLNHALCPHCNDRGTANTCCHFHVENSFRQKKSWPFSYLRRKEVKSAEQTLLDSQSGYSPTNPSGDEMC